jgi:threonine dehydratase
MSRCRLRSDSSRADGLALAHSTNDRTVLAGAATLSLEMFEQAGTLDAIVAVVGGGSQAVGAITVARALSPSTKVYAAQATGGCGGARLVAQRPAHHPGACRHLCRRSRHAQHLRPHLSPRCRAGLAGFVTVSDAEIADAVRLLMSTTHSLVEGAGAGGLAALRTLAPQLAGQRVGIIVSGGNIDEATLRRIILREL